MCRDQLHGVAWHGLSCEVCKFKSHRRCVFNVQSPCKWTTRSSLSAAGVDLEQDVSSDILAYSHWYLWFSVISSFQFPMSGMRETYQLAPSVLCVTEPAVQ